jgi:hypothetical protein
MVRFGGYRKKQKQSIASRRPRNLISCLLALLVFLLLTKRKSISATSIIYTTNQSWVRSYDINQSIPLSLWQTAKTAKLGPQQARTRDTWLNKNPDLTYTLHDDQDADVFVNRHYQGPVQDVYRAFPIPIMRADLWRYLVIYVHGGIYGDVDVECITPIKDWFPPRRRIPDDKYDHYMDDVPNAEPYFNLSWDDCAAVVGMEHADHISNWTFAAIPGHPFFRTLIELIIERAQKGIQTWNDDVVHRHTGPQMMTEALVTFLNMRKKVDWPCTRVNWGADYGSQCAVSILEKLWNDPEVMARAREARLCVMGMSFFASDRDSTPGAQNVQNLFGAMEWSDDGGHHDSWLKDKDKLVRDAPE